MLRILTKTRGSVLRSMTCRTMCSTTGSDSVSTKLMREPGVVGLEEDTNSRETLSVLYKQTLDAIKEIPADASYRTNVEKITNYRLSVVEGAESTEKIEETLNVGQMPEIIEQAQDELDLIGHMAQWKPWETDGNKPVVIEVAE